MFKNTREPRIEGSTNDQLDQAIGKRNAHIWRRAQTYGSEASMYRQMADEARKLFESHEGTWPTEGQTLEEHVASRRPSLDIKWSKAKTFHNGIDDDTGELEVSAVGQKRKRGDR